MNLHSNCNETEMSTISSTPIVIDGKGHLLGRLASVLAKQVSVSKDSWIQEGKDHGEKEV